MSAIEVSPGNRNIRAGHLTGVQEIIDDAKNGKMFVLVDDEGGGTEGELVIPAQMATPDAVNFMATHGRGLICLALTRRRVEQLELPLMSGANASQRRSAFTVSIEARSGVSTGISVADRARTIAVAIDASSRADAIVSPGHVFPLVARDGGVLVRAGHAEGAVDIARLAGLNPSAVICAVMDDDGNMARWDTLLAFAERHRLKICAIRDLIAYRRRHDHLVRCVGERPFVSTHGGEWTALVYANRIDGSEILVLRKGRVEADRPTLVRMHSVSPYTDLLAEVGNRSAMLHNAMDRIGEAGAGVIVLLRDTAPDFLSNMVLERDRAPSQEIRDYGIGAQILADLNVHEMILLTNSDHLIVGVEGYGLQIVEKRLL
jgi:3,4-dihydroxy 2-butanone 4-phosphate synthase/GTP cyclohydrolase II